MAFKIARPATAFQDAPDKRKRRMIDNAHLAYIRLLPCVITGKYGCEAAHVRFGSAVWNKPNTGKGVKPSDCWVLPLRPEIHADQHQHNEREWWLAKSIDPLAIAADLYEVSGDVNAGIEIIRKGNQQ